MKLWICIILLTIYTSQFIIQPFIWIFCKSNYVLLLVMSRYIAFVLHLHFDWADQFGSFGVSFTLTWVFLNPVFCFINSSFDIYFLPCVIIILKFPFPYSHLDSCYIFMSGDNHFITYRNLFLLHILSFFWGKLCPVYQKDYVELLMWTLVMPIYYFQHGILINISSCHLFINIILILQFAMSSLIWNDSSLLYNSMPIGVRKAIHYIKVSRTCFLEFSGTMNSIAFSSWLILLLVSYN